MSVGKLFSQNKYLLFPRHCRLCFFLIFPQICQRTTLSLCLSIIFPPPSSSLISLLDHSLSFFVLSSSFLFPLLTHPFFFLLSALRFSLSSPTCGYTRCSTYSDICTHMHAFLVVVRLSVSRSAAATGVAPCQLHAISTHNSKNALCLARNTSSSLSIYLC